MISDGSCDTEDWSNDAENSALITGIHYILKSTYKTTAIDKTSIAVTTSPGLCISKGCFVADVAFSYLDLDACKNTYIFVFEKKKMVCQRFSFDGLFFQHFSPFTFLPEHT